MDGSTDRSMDRSMERSTNRLVDPPIDRSVKRTVGGSVGRSVGRLPHRSVGRCIDRPTHRQCADNSDGQLASFPVDSLLLALILLAPVSPVPPSEIPSPYFFAGSTLHLPCSLTSSYPLP